MWECEWIVLVLKPEEMEGKRVIYNVVKASISTFQTSASTDQNC